MALLSGNWGELLQPGLRVIFDKQIKQQKDYLPVLFNVEDSKKAQEFNLGVGELSTMDAWNGQVSYEDFSKGFKSTYTHTKWSKGIQIERELVDDDQYVEIKKRVRKLANVVYFTQQTQGASVFNGAFSGTAGPDNLSLCNAAHPVAPGSATTYSNTDVLSLTAVNLETVRTRMKKWKDDKGNLIMIQPDMLIVPPNLRKTAQIIAETKEEPDTTDHGVNVWQGAVKVVEWEFLTSDYAWFNEGPTTFAIPA